MCLETSHFWYYPMTWLGTARILSNGILQCRPPTMHGSAIIWHKHFLDSDINNGVMTIPTANNGHDDITELPVTSQWFGMY